MSLIKVKTGWTRLVGVDGWRLELKKLIAEAHAAASQDEVAPRQEVAAFLAGFIQESSPQTPEMDQLDDMAQSLAVDIMKQTIDERLAMIAQRTAEYAKLEKQFDAAAEHAEDAAESNRLTGITNLIDSSTKAIAAAKQLVKSLDDSAGDQKVAALIQDTIEAVEKLRTAAAKLI